MMNCTVSKFVIFTVGAAIGSAVTWKILRSKYEQIAQDEIDSMREFFIRKYADDTIDNDDSVEPEVEEQISVEDYRETLASEGYTNYSQLKKETKEVKRVVKPYVISPDMFGEEDDYDTESLTYYADKVLTDDMDERIEDVDYVVGLDSLNHFGEYEDDSVFVRNEELKVDYEILLDSRKYSDVIKNNPHRAED